jgi:hypothetical protein
LWRSFFSWGAMLTNDDFARTLDELDRLLNDPDVPMEPALIWRLVAEVSERAWDGTLEKILAKSSAALISNWRARCTHWPPRYFGLRENRA